MRWYAVCERLAHRSLVGLEVAGAFQGDHRRVPVLRCQEAAALLERVVCRLHVRLISTSNEVPGLNGAVPDFVPFRALHFAGRETDLTAVCSPPYDVIDDDDRAALQGLDDHNVVRLILPDSYDGAADLVLRGRPTALTIDDTPSFSVYRMTFTGDDGRPAVTTGVIGTLTLEAGGVLPHERTLPKAKSDRLELLRATRAQLRAHLGHSLTSGLSALLTVDDVPTAVADDADGGRHELFRIDDPERIAAIRAAVEATGIVLADGHHRYETSCTYRDEVGDRAGAGQIMIYVVELADDQLCVRAIHRLLHGVTDVDLRSSLGAHFEVRDDGRQHPRERHRARTCDARRRQWSWWARPRRRARPGAAHTAAFARHRDGRAPRVAA